MAKERDEEQSCSAGGHAGGGRTTATGLDKDWAGWSRWTWLDPVGWVRSVASGVPCSLARLRAPTLTQSCMPPSRPLRSPPPSVLFPFREAITYLYSLSTPP